MKNNIIDTKEILEIESFAKKIEFELNDYHVYLSAEIFKTKNPITTNNIQKIVQEMCPDVKIRGDFPLRTFEEIKNILRPAFSYDLMDGSEKLAPGIWYIDISHDHAFIKKQEQEFWNIIESYFSLPPQKCFEYEPDENITKKEDEPYFPSGSWWEFFVVLSNENKGIILEGTAYD